MTAMAAAAMVSAMANVAMVMAVGAHEIQRHTIGRRIHYNRWCRCYCRPCCTLVLLGTCATRMSDRGRPLEWSRADDSNCT